MNRNPEDYGLMPGRRVAEHLLAAESARMRNETYDFPGGVRFPIKNFDFNIREHYPFPYDSRFGWNAARLLRGYQVYSDMISKWLDDKTLQYMKFLELPGLGIEMKFNLTPRNQRQTDQGEGEYIIEELISTDAPDADDQPNQHANEAGQLINDPPVFHINNEASVESGQAANRAENQVTFQNAATVTGSINPAEAIDIDVDVNIDSADNQSVQPNANAMNATNAAEGGQIPAVEQMEIDIDINVNIDANQANQAEANAPDYNDAVDFQAAFINRNVPARVRRPILPRQPQNLPQLDDNDPFQIDPPQIRNRRRNRRNQNPRPVHRPVPFENDVDFLNLLDLFENQLHGQPGRPVFATDFDLPIPDLSEELLPHDVEPVAGVPNDIQNAPPINDQEIVNVENFEDFQQSGPVQQSSPVRQPVQNEPQPSGLSPILEVENEVQDDYDNVIYLNVASTVASLQPEATHNEQSNSCHIVQSVSGRTETIGAQVFSQVECDQPNPVLIDDQPVVEFDPEAELQQIRAELARWRRNHYRGTNPRNRAPPRPLPWQNYHPEDFAVRQVPHENNQNNMVHPRLALEDMTKVYRLIHEFLSQPEEDPVPIEVYLRNFQVGERFKALIGLADAVEENSLLINIDDNNQITGFRRVPD